MGIPRLSGREAYGADAIPPDALFVRAIRSPYHRARFSFGDLDAFMAANPGIIRVLTAADIPGRNIFGVIPPFADQPVFATGETRFRGEAVAAIVGECSVISDFDEGSFPIVWTERPAVLTPEQAEDPSAALIHENRPGNILVRGRVIRGDTDTAIAGAAAVVEGEFSTGFVEHAYIEPEAGWARRVKDRIEVTVSTQSPYLDRDDVAAILGIAPDAVRIIPSACGGGFGSKLDLSVQPFVALAAWLLGRPAAMVYTRPESIASTTKRHPARMRSRMAADADGRLAGDGVRWRLQYRRLCVMGADRRQPRAGSRVGSLCRSQLPRREPRGSDELRACRRLPRIRRAADRHCPGADAGHAGAQAGSRPAGLPHRQCAHRYDTDRHRPGHG